MKLVASRESMVMKSLFALAFVGWFTLTCNAPAQAKIQIENVQACYGPFGPERKSLDFYPFDILFLRFTVTGLKKDASGSVDTVVKMKWTDAKGQLLGEKTFPASGILHLGGNSFLLFVNLPMPEPEKIPLGKSTVTVTVTDNLSKESASFERQLTGHNSKLRIVALEFFHDAEGKFPSSTNLPPGEPLHFRLRVIGFDRSKEKIHTVMAVQTLDAEGKENLPKPLLSTIHEDEAKAVQRTGFVFFTGRVGPNRVGKFTLRITVTDRMTDQSTKIEVPINVTAP
jgi:hypothetical protein